MNFTEAQLVSFGNYLLSRYNVQEYSNDGRNVPLFQRVVHDADLANWKHEESTKPNPYPWETKEHTNYPSRYALDEYVWYRLWSCDVPATINAVHFYHGKVKYDLELLGQDGDKTRIYNVDSAYVQDKIPEKAYQK